MQPTNTARKLVYYVAMSIDHYIARDDQTIDGFAMEGPAVSDYMASLQGYDTVLMGRRTYEWGYQFGLQPGQPVPTYGHMMQYVFSSTMQPYDHEQIKVIRQDAAVFVRQLKAAEGGSIYLCGGGQLAGYLMARQLVDEVILKVNPVVFGSGIPLFGNVQPRTTLTLLSTRQYDDGLVFLHYAVNIKNQQRDADPTSGDALAFYGGVGGRVHPGPRFGLMH